MSSAAARCEKWNELSEKTRVSVDTACANAQEVAELSADILSDELQRLDDYAHVEPWRVAAGAFIGGFLLGVILSGR